MRLPHLRFTVRRLMVAVAIIAILIGVGLQIRQTIRFSRLAARYAEDGLFWRSQERNHRALGEKMRTASVDPEQGSGAAEFWRPYIEYQAERVEKIKALADFHARMKTKYEAAARRPWFSVEPDPPRPDLR
jgi:hypothetical protein